jgi:hypothetical protein
MLGLALAFSYHIGGADYTFNSLHPHVSFTTDDAWVTGAYYNSENNLSIYAGKVLQYNEDLALEVGAVTGYVDTILPYARVTYKDFFLAPAVYGSDKELGLVIGFEFKVK